MVINRQAGAYHLCQGIKWRHIDTACICILRKRAENSKLGADGLSTAGRCSNEHVVIAVVDSIEHCTTQYNGHFVPDSITNILHHVVSNSIHTAIKTDPYKPL